MIAVAICDRCSDSSATHALIPAFASKTSVSRAFAAASSAAMSTVSPHEQSSLISISRGRSTRQDTRIMTHKHCVSIDEYKLQQTLTEESKMRMET
ncbi:hypothetical protein PsorP6_004919 [Peronosclerospora sorghi]|uniref:Uncharacterized protein n=1 Tax=Peronosclerospora sorghi TaxID=230839 RepID=A0ACC0W4M6_9STRA|nr:hypothetical protein PsorP6_004919 [Peronosclerospora sorghi]